MKLVSSTSSSGSTISSLASSLQIDHRLLAGLQAQREDQVVIDHRPPTDRQRIASDHGLTPSVLPRVVDAQRNAVEHGPLEQQIPAAGICLEVVHRES
jgi:hypothetical protein